MKKGRKGFTLVELLVVIVIIAIMAAVATPLVMHYVEDANKKSDAVFFEALDSATFTAINQLKKAGKSITVANVINETYSTYNGAYNEEHPVLGSTKGDALYFIVPVGSKETPEDGNYVTVELAQVMSGKKVMGNGFVLRLYKNNALVDGMETYTIVKSLTLPENSPVYQLVK